MASTQSPVADASLVELGLNWGSLRILFLMNFPGHPVASESRMSFKMLRLQRNGFRSWGVALWQSICLTFMRPWVCSPAPQGEKDMGPSLHVQAIFAGPFSAPASMTVSSPGPPPHPPTLLLRQ
jgi:hypothetical protein